MSSPLDPVSPYGPAADAAEPTVEPSPYQPAPSYAGAPPSGGSYQPSAASVAAYTQPNAGRPPLMQPPARWNGLGVTAIVFAVFAMLVALVSSGSWMQGVLFFGVPAILFGGGGLLRRTKSRVSPIVALSMVGVAIVWSGVVAVIDANQYDEYDSVYEGSYVPSDDDNVDEDEYDDIESFQSSFSDPLPPGTTIELLGADGTPEWSVIVSPVRWDAKESTWGEGAVSEVDVTITNLRDREAWTGFVEVAFVDTSGIPIEAYVLDEDGEYVRTPDLAAGQTSTTTRTLAIDPALRDSGLWRISDFTEEYVSVE